MSNTSELLIEPSPAEKYFGLAARPFSLTPDLRFQFHSRSHTHALEQVTTALRRREGLIVVTGAIGTGKTMLCRSMLDSFEPRTFLSVILDPGLEVEDLLRKVLTDFGIMGGIEASPSGRLPDVTRHQFVSTLQRFLSSLATLKAHAVIMIDEAQRLNTRVLEEIRLLTNFETDEAKLLQIVLVGQPELDEVLRQPAMQQLNQRVARRCELQPLSPNEIGDYIERRLTVAASPEALGGKDSGSSDAGNLVRFSPEAVEAVALISQGIPRLINTLCDRALDSAYERPTRLVDRESVIEAAEQLRLDIPGELSEPQRKRMPWLVAAAVGLLIAGAAAWWFLPRTPSLAPAQQPAARTPAAAPASETGSSTNTPVVEPAPPAPPTADAATPPEPAPEAADATPATPAATPVTARTEPQTPPPPAYQIAVASFRTEQRATDVVAAITALDLPSAVRTDEAGVWFRVIAGPFANREAALAAQQRLSSGGFDGTQVSQIVPETRRSR